MQHWMAADIVELFYRYFKVKWLGPGSFPVIFSKEILPLFQKIISNEFVKKKYNPLGNSGTS